MNNWTRAGAVRRGARILVQDRAIAGDIPAIGAFLLGEVNVLLRLEL